MFVSVGIAWMEDAARAAARADLARIDAVVRSEFGRGHVEPEISPTIGSPRRGASFPRPWLHALRRLYARARLDGPILPLAPGNSALQDSWLVDLFEMDESGVVHPSHLACHFDDFGYFVPVFLFEPVRNPAFPGGVVGSVDGLNEELVVCAKALGLDLDDLEENGAGALMKAARSDPWAAEKFALGALWTASEEASEDKVVVVLH